MSHSSTWTRRDVLRASATAITLPAFLPDSVLGGEGPARADDPAATPVPPRPKNVLPIMCDAYHAQAFSFLGHPSVRTPNLDRLARGGTVFDNAVCAYSRSRQ